MPALSLKKLYPVIHCVSPEKQGVGHALANTRIAMKNGADGIFLIGHEIHFMDLFYIYEQVRKQFHEIWIGINFLDISHQKDWDKLSAVAKGCYNLNALWIDYVPNERLALPPSIQVFGGVAFKYINPHLDGEDLKKACRKAVQCIDVVTTSGDKTGSAPNVTKLKSIKDAIGKNFPLALASGVDSINVSDFLELVDIFIVASSICEIRHDLDDAEYLEEVKVHELAQIIHS